MALIVAYALQKMRVVLFLLTDLTEVFVRLLHSRNIKIFLIADIARISGNKPYK